MQVYDALGFLKGEWHEKKDDALLGRVLLNLNEPSWTNERTKEGTLEYTIELRDLIKEIQFRPWLTLIP